MALRSGALRRSLELEKAMREEPHKGIDVPFRRGQEQSLLSFHMLGYTKKVSICKSGRGSSPDTKSAVILILDFYNYER